LVEKGNFFALFAQRKDHVTAGVTCTPQFSSDLLNWQDNEVDPSIFAEDANNQIMSVPYPPLTAGNHAVYFRLKVSLAP
jgi:hypothetical protein